METLKYTVIKSEAQYQAYCKALETLVCEPTEGAHQQEEIEMLTLLIERWDQEHTTLAAVNPVELLQGLMAEKQLKASELAKVLGVGKSLVSDILSYKRGLSKAVIRKLATYFQLTQEAFNRPYKLKTSTNTEWKDAAVMNHPKDLELVH